MIVRKFCSCNLLTLQALLIESVQYQVGLIVGGCWQGTNKTTLFKELGWESLSDRRIFRRLSLYYKIKNDDAPQYLFDHLLASPPSGTLRYRNSFFPYCFNAWQDLDPTLKDSDSLSSFKTTYLKKIRPTKSNVFGIHDRIGLPLLTRSRVNFSDLREHRFNHKFNCPSPLCQCTLDSESTEHFFLRCPQFSSPRQHSFCLIHRHISIPPRAPHRHTTIWKSHF